MKTRSTKTMQAIVIIGVALSVAVLIITLSVTRGFEEAYKKSLLEFNAHLMISPVEDSHGIREKIEARVPSANVSPFLYREGLLIHRGIIKGIVIKGIPFSNHEPPFDPLAEFIPSKVEGLRAGTAQGRRTTNHDIILGEELAKKLEVTPGEEVKLLIPKKGEVSSKNIVRLPVADTFQTGLYEFDSQFALMDIKALQRLFNLPSSYLGFEIRLSDPNGAPKVEADLEQALGPLVSIQNWMELNEPLFSALNLEKWVFRILMGLMVFTSTLNLMGTILLSIFRGQKRIAILRALGLSSQKVKFLFSRQGFVLGLVGVGFGVLLAWVFATTVSHFHWIALDPQVYFLKTLPIIFEPVSVFIIAFLSLLLVWQISYWASAFAAALPIREGLHGPG